MFYGITRLLNHKVVLAVVMLIACIRHHNRTFLKLQMG